MKTILLSIVLSFCASTSTNSYVYICTGPKAKVYHRTTRCSGLNNCSGSIKKITVAQAKQMGRRACRKCY